MNTNSNVRIRLAFLIIIAFAFGIGFWGGFEYKTSLVKVDYGIIQTSLDNARVKGMDARIKATLSQFRAGAELYWDTHNGSYSGFCESITKEYEQIEKFKIDYYCKVSNDGKQYAISSSLKLDPKTYFCVDSTGKASDTKSKLGNSASCN